MDQLTTNQATTLQSKLEKIGNALVAGFTVDKTVTVNVYHYWRPKMQAPFVVWAEDGESYERINADNHKAEQAITGYLDYYTKTEYDPKIDTIQDILNGMNGFPFSWYLDSVQYEDDTNLIHYQWIWRVA